METFYVKSFEQDFILKTLKGKKKVPFQSIQNILKTSIVKPNTKSFGREQRLACTALSKNYLKTYRAQGLIFQTKEKPDHMAPFDLVILTKAKKIIVQYYRMQDNLHLYYNHQLIPGFKKFIFQDSKKMFKTFNSPEKTWKAVNEFRQKAGFKPLSKQKYKLIQYNEIVFNNPIKIKPIAIFGYRKIAREIAKQHNLPHFISAKNFYEKLKN